MAKQAKESSKALAALTPNSVDVKIDGEVVRVAMSKSENQILNLIMAGQLRVQINKSIKKWKDMEMCASPKELKDLASAMRDLAQFSTEILANEVVPSKPPEREADRTDEPDFSNLKKPIEVTTEEKKDEQNTT